eukprot:COSAG06_NODE_4977_length_3815_cov_2.324004_3_plen_251_part_00
MPLVLQQRVQEGLALVLAIRQSAVADGCRRVRLICIQQLQDQQQKTQNAEREYARLAYSPASPCRANTCSRYSHRAESCTHRGQRASSLPGKPASLFAYLLQISSGSVLVTQIAGTAARLARAAFKDLERVEAFCVLKEEEAALDPAHTAALQQETADLQGHYDAIIANLSLGAANPRDAMRVLINNDEIRAIFRREQVEAVGLDVSDTAFRYMRQIDAAFQKHVADGGVAREALIPGCVLADDNGHKAL